MNDQQRTETAADNCEVLRARLARYEDGEGKPITTIAEQSREIERLQLTCNDIDDQNDRIYAELAALKAQPGRVVMPDSEHMQDMIDRLCDSASKEDAVFGWHECLEFVARLNSSPVSAGDDRETIRAVFLRNGFTIKEGQADLKPYVYAAADELMSIARAALSAPSHGEQVRDWIPVSERLPENENPVMVVVGDEVITASYWRHGDKHHGDDGWADSFSNDELEGVTHWMPLPSAPSAGSQEQGE